MVSIDSFVNNVLWPALMLSLFVLTTAVVLYHMRPADASKGNEQPAPAAKGPQKPTP